MGALLAILTGLFTIAGNIFAKEWATKSGVVLFAMTLFFYLLSSITFPIALKYGTLSTFVTLASLTSLSVTTAIGIFYYREELSTVHAVGLVVGIIAMVLLTLPGKT